MSATKKNVVITGCSSGIGKALAQKFHAEGYTVFAGARRLAAMQDLADLGVHTYYLDVTKQDTIDAFRDAIEPLTKGKLAYLVNNAGQPYTMPALDVDMDHVTGCFDVNFHGVVRMTKTFGPWVVADKGKIVQVGSVTSVLPIPFGSIYSATKAALQCYSGILRAEMKPFGVEVITIITGGVDSTIDDGEGYPLPNGSLFADAKEALHERQHLSRLSNPMPCDEYARQVFAAVSPQSIPEVAWIGSSVFVSWLATEWLPRSLLTRSLWRRFKMQPFTDRLQTKTKE